MVSPIYRIDFYKSGHINQYPRDTEQVWSNWTARSTRVVGQKWLCWFGLQRALLDLLDSWEDEFFAQDFEFIKQNYVTFMRATLGLTEPRTDHLEALHSLGHLPLDVWALPEGTLVPIGVPLMVLTNTDPHFFWLPNYLETTLSNALWKASTSATMALRFRELFKQYACKFGETDYGFVDWQGHDFSYRGMSGLEDAEASGMGHLVAFSGTDTVPAILAAQDYYGARPSCGGSVPATEHSVMCAGTQEGEFETFKRLITETYKAGVVSIVSDTWDLWKVLTDYVPRLKPEILKRDGKVVIRPDSGDPVKIMLGDDTQTGPARMGALRLLAEAMGTDGQGHINKAGLIYGDGITLERADQILQGCLDYKLSPYNIVFGIGSYTYEHVTRDEYGFAMKATAVRRASKIVDIFKNPATGTEFSKKSLKGIPIVFRNAEGLLSALDGRRPEELDDCAYQKVLRDGELAVFEDFEQIRKRARGGL